MEDVKKIKVRKKHICDYCGNEISSGEHCYFERDVFFGEGVVFVDRYYQCIKCNYKEESRKIRFEKFKINCHHPVVETSYCYMPGECVEMPDYDECLICGERF